MYFYTFHGFLQMGGYAAYVWGAYGVVALTWVSLWWSARSKLKRLLSPAQKPISPYAKYEAHASET